jgi:hypothetical protein
MSIQVNQVGVDFAAMPDPQGYPGLAHNGARFVCRYSDGTGGGGKRTRPHEIADAVAAGLDFLANFEFFEDTPEEGAASGRRHGRADRDFWDERGLAPGAGVIISWEPGNDRSKFTDVAAFVEHYRDAVRRPVGMYAGLPALVWMRRRELIDFTWLPMSSAASGLDFGDVPQTRYAAKMRQVAEDNALNLVQNRNRWYRQGVDASGNPRWGADENIVITMPERPWSHVQALHAAPRPSSGPMHPAVPQPHPHGAPQPVPSGPGAGKLWQGAPWPGHQLGFGPDDHFGSVNGPATSRGGADPAERPFVRMIQQRLIVCGFVPGHSDPDDSWADGIFDVPGSGRPGGPTTDAVTLFQEKCRPGALTTRPGEVWSDDWGTLFNLH